MAQQYLTQCRTRRTKATVVAAAFLACTLWISRSEAQTIAVFTKNRVNPNYAALRLGADRAAEAAGATTIHLVPDTPDDPVEQIALLGMIPKERPDAVIFNPADEARVAEAFRSKVAEPGIPTINIVNRANYADKIAFVGADDEAIGYATAQYLLNALGGTGNVVILEGPSTAVTAVDRLRGFKRAIAEHPGIRVTASIAGKYLQTTAMEQMQAALAKGTLIDGVIAANDSMALGALDALDRAGRSSTVKVVGINGIPDAIKAIEDGRLLATEDYSGFKLGCISAMAAIRYLRGLPVPRTINLPVLMIDKSNYAELKVPPKDRKCPAWTELMQ